jgi:DNA-binding CsgD family transcriptional regulator
VTAATTVRCREDSTQASEGNLAQAPALIGRRCECQALEAMVDTVRHGRSGVLVLRGPSGIGKTALLRHLVTVASGFTVTRATGAQSEMDLPFAGLHQLCSPWLGHLAELPEPQRIAASTAFGLTAGPTPDRLLIGLATSNLLAAAADGRPLLCVVDDAHLLDGDSTNALAFVARRLLAERVALVFATRSPIKDVAGFPELLVDRLADVDAHILLSTLLRAPVDEGVRARIVKESGGNPLTLTEWPHRLTASGLAGGFAEPNEVTATNGTETTFRQQVGQLPPTTRRFLTVAAAEPTGDPIVVWRAASALGLEPFVATPAVEAGLLDIGMRIVFRHPVVRTVSYRDAALGDRQAAHRALAEATDPELDPDRRAWHSALGSHGLDEAIAEALEQSVGRAQARGGLAAAATVLERAAALTAVPARRARRLLGSAAAHLNAGSFEHAGGLLAMAEATTLDDAGRAQLDVLRARHATIRGDLRAGTALHRRAAVRLEPIDLDLAYAAHLEAMGTAAIAGLGDAFSLREAAVATLACLRSHEPTELESLAIGLAGAIVDGTPAATPVLRKVLSGPDAALGADEYRWLAFKATAATVLWDLDALRDLSMVRVERASAAGALSMLPGALNTMANVFVLEGDLDTARSAIREAMEIVDVTRRHLVMSAAAQLAALSAADDAAEWLDEQVDAARIGSPGLSPRAALWARATLANGARDYDKAFAVASEAIELPRAWSALTLHEHIEAAVRSGQRNVAAGTLDRLIPSTTASGSDWALGIQHRCRAMLADDADADDLYRRAIGHLRRTRLRPELARTHLLYGEWLRRANRRADARAELQAAYDMFMSMGINGFADRCRHELLSTGASVRKRSVESNRELTSQELEVSRLALDGFTNAEIGGRLFISVRTVEWHLRKVFAKLGISSRRELTAVLSSHRVPTTTGPGRPPTLERRGVSMATGWPPLPTTPTAINDGSSRRDGRMAC